MTPLNPSLYKRLKLVFGSVVVTGDGERMLYKAVRGHANEPRILVKHAGEAYRVNCCFCRDTRHRLYVSYLYGQRDKHGRLMTYAAHCFNEGCLHEAKNRSALAERLGDAEWLESAPVDPGVTVPEEARVVPSPGRCLRIDRVPTTHPGRAYLEARGFDPAILWARFRVAYCETSDYFLARDRIIIPIYDHGKLKGWQARYPGELKWKGEDKDVDAPPKYFSCPGSRFRSTLIYNWDHMRQWETGIIVEGPTDVWRFGPMAGCVFGNTMTERQRQKFLAVFRKRSGVLLFDPEEHGSDKQVRLLDYLKQRMPQLCAVKLPDKSDPGSLDRAFMWEYVRAEAAAQGVTVRYRRAA